MVSVRSVLAKLVLASVAAAQFVKEPTGFTKKTGYAGVNVRYKEVPTGICELDPNVKSYSGYADVSENEHIFWWFFEARNGDPTEAPLTVWINGGPGSSSMIGLFQELGPCGVGPDGKPYNNPYSWSNVSNMIFIDQPAQVGMSYSIPIPGYVDNNSGNIIVLPDEECPSYAPKGSCGTYSWPNVTLTANTTEGAAPNFWKTLQGFMGAFPQYSRNGFHFTTESYGGHYGPVFNEYIEQQNKHLPYGAKEIKLESVLIGNGWFDPLIQYQAYYNFTVYPGNTYDYKPFTKEQEKQMYNNMYGRGNCYDQTVDCYNRGWNEICSTADNFCYLNVEYLFDLYANRDEYDSRELMPDPFPYTYYVDYLNTPHVQAAIGAYQNFSESSSTVSTAFGTTGDDDRPSMTIQDVKKLLKQGIQVVMYYGDADYNCNWLGGQVVADRIAAPGYSSAGFINITTSDDIVHGQVRQSGSFSFVRIYESGHEVPFYQPVVSLEMFERAINNKDIATGETTLSSSYKTSGPKTSDYREGNSTVQFEVLPKNSTYNTTTNAPNPPNRKRHAKVKRRNVWSVPKEDGLYKAGL